MIPFKPNWKVPVISSAIFLSIYIALGVVGQTKDSTKPKDLLPPQRVERRLTVTFNESTWVALVSSLDRADVSHITIRQLQDSLNRAFNDSTKNKPVKK